MQQTHTHGKFARGRVLKVLATVRSPSKPRSTTFNELALPLQTWLAGNTASDLLIAAAMLYHVDRLRFALGIRPMLIAFTQILQLAQRRARDGRLSNHALVSVVRLTVETNIMTSKSLPSPDTTSMIALFSPSHRQCHSVANGCPFPSE